MNPASSSSAFQLPSFEQIPSQELGGRGLYWQQRLVGSFDNARNSFDIDGFLKPDVPPISQQQGLEVLIAMQRSIVPYKDFFHDLPKIRYIDPSRPPPDITKPKIVGALRSLIGGKQRGWRGFIDDKAKKPLANEEFDLLVKKYGGKGEDVISLMVDLIENNPKIDRDTAFKTLRLFHGDLRAETYLSMAELSKVSLSSPQDWTAFLGRLSSNIPSSTLREMELVRLGGQERLRQHVCEYLHDKTDDWLVQHGLKRDQANPSIIYTTRGKRVIYNLNHWENAERLWNDHFSKDAGERGRTGDQVVADRSQKDYYQILGVPIDAGDRQIRKTFQKRAFELHPDRNKASDAEERFKELNEAFQVLTDKEKRKAYNLSRRPAQKVSSTTPKESSTPKENIVGTWGKASHIRGIPSDYVEIDGRPGWYANEKNGKMVDSRTGAGAQTLLDALLVEEPDLAEELGLYTIKKEAKAGVSPKGREKPSTEAPKQQKDQAAGEEKNFTSDDIAGATDKGRKRVNNEDSFYISADGKVFAVFDGVGGAEHGEMASGIARQVFEQRGRNTDLRILLEQVNREIFEMSRQLSIKGRMATTGTAGMIRGNKLYLAHVGDSRAYLSYQGMKLIQLTKDHTVVQELIDTGAITPEQATTHLKRNTLTRSLGTGLSVRVDERVVDLASGDTIVLCTDGLDKVFTREGILWGINQSAPRAVVDNFIREGNKRGAPDNITVIVRKFKG